MENNPGSAGAGIENDFLAAIATTESTDRRNVGGELVGLIGDVAAGLADRRGWQDLREPRKRSEHVGMGDPVGGERRGVGEADAGDAGEDGLARGVDVDQPLLRRPVAVVISA